MADARTKREEDPGRQSRAMDNRENTENRQISDDERMELYRNQFYQHVLPDLPDIDGYHVCWLTTTNPRDSIHNRMRLGYEPITPADVPGYDSYSMKTGEWAGCIGINEMVAFKLPLSLYERYMNEAHSRAPHAEQAKITALIDELNDQAQQVGGRIMEGDGMSELRASPKPVKWAPH